MQGRLQSQLLRAGTLLTALGVMVGSGCGGARITPCNGSPCNPAQAIGTIGAQSNGGEPEVREVSAPDWIAKGGNSLAYPIDAFLTGIAVAKGDDAMKRAMADAAADLANRVTVHIEHELTDVSSEKNGKVDYHIAAMTKLTSDIRIQGLRYEIAHVGNDVYALAYVRRSDAVIERRLLLDRTLLELRGCMEAARSRKAGRVSSAAAGYFQCLRHVTAGFQHDAVIRTIEPKRGSTRPQQDLVQILQEIRDETGSLNARPVASLREAADLLALQLGASGALAYAFHEPPSFLYGVTNFASAFGQRLSLDLENAIARQNAEAKRAGPEARLAVIRGVYFEEGQNIRITATQVEVATGRLVGGAETVIAKSSLPDSLTVLPRNLETALADQRLLSTGELVDGTLRLEVWADKGKRGVVYAESEEMRLFVRVNAPAYVRLIYVLESGVQVPIDQAYYIDSSKVNMAVEYPERFEIAAPFGVEHVHATAFTKRPEPLPITSRVIGGTNYSVIQDGLSSVVRHRGIVRKEKDEVAESLLSITTLPSSQMARH